MNKVNKLNEEMEKLTKNIKLRFSSIVIAIIIWGFLFFANILTVSFMADFYNRSSFNSIKVVLILFLIIFTYVMFFIVYVMVLGEMGVFSIISFVAIFINIAIALFPHKMNSSGILVYSDFLLWSFAITDTIICAWIGTHFKSLNNIFVTKEVKKTYKQNEITVEETIKNYPILLPIVTAIIAASGAVIAALLER